jgi:aspartate racemase
MNWSNQLGLGRLGILEGMGTAATAHFLQTLARRSRAKTDQDHIPYLLLSLFSPKWLAAN